MFLYAMDSSHLHGRRFIHMTQTHVATPPCPVGFYLILDAFPSPNWCDCTHNMCQCLEYHQTWCEHCLCTSKPLAIKLFLPTTYWTMVQLNFCVTCTKEGHQEWKYLNLVHDGLLLISFCPVFGSVFAPKQLQLW